MPREPFFHALWRQNRKGPLVVAALLLLNLLGLVIVSRVVAPRVEKARSALALEQGRLRQEKAGEAPLESGASYRQGRSELEQFRQSLLPREELTVFLGEVYSLARDNGLAIDRITYDPEALTEQGLLRYTLRFSVSGGYAQIKKFIFSFEHSDRIMILDKMSLSGEQAEQDRVALQLELTTYFIAGNR
jgi:type IV pilus assembly protein PilO